MDSACHDSALTRINSGESTLVLKTPCRIISGPLAANTGEEDTVHSTYFNELQLAWGHSYRVRDVPRTIVMQYDSTAHAKSTLKL